MSARDYHLGREQQELHAAEAAAEDKARRAHLDLAARHAARAEQEPIVLVSMLPA